MENTEKKEVTKEDWDNFAKTSIPELEKRGYLNNYNKKPKQVVSYYGTKNNETGKKWIFAVVVLWLLSLCLIYYAGDNGWFNPSVNQSVDVEPITENTYEFKPTTNNSFNNLN